MDDQQPRSDEDKVQRPSPTGEYMSSDMEMGVGLVVYTSFEIWSDLYRKIQLYICIQGVIHDDAEHK